MLKNYLLLILVFVGVFHTQAQQVRFSYDDSGNRIRQEVIILKADDLPASVSQETDTTRLQVRIADDVLNIKLYPNPVSETLTLECPGGSASYQINAKIFSANGFSVYQNTFHDIPCQIDLSGVVPGIYFLQLSINHSEFSYKIIKQ